MLNLVSPRYSQGGVHTLRSIDPSLLYIRELAAEACQRIHTHAIAQHAGSHILH